MNKIQEYFNSPNISQSDLIALSKSPYMFKRKKENKAPYTSDALTLGSAVDCLLTDTDNWDNRFHVLTVQKPSGQMGEYVDRLLAGDSQTLAYDKVEFKRDSFDKVTERFKKEGKEYFEEVVNSKSKITLSFEMYEQAQKIKEDFLNSKYTKEYFICNENEKIYFQHPIYFSYDNVDCKALIDIIKVNTKTKTIILIDIKTTEFLPTFKDSFWKYRHDLQSAWYTLAISYWQNSEYSDYQILPFKFIVAEKCCGHKPWIFQTSYNTLTIGMLGETINNKLYKGYRTLIKEYKFYKAKEEWNYPIELLQDNIIQI